MTDLPTALRALTDDQPLQPPDRVSAVTGRARRVRRNRRLASGLAAVALLVPAGVLALGSGGAEDLQPASTSVLDWPDRSVATDRAVAEGALTEQWRTGSYGAAAPGDVRWLYRAPVRLPDGSVEYVAVFTATDTDVDGLQRHSLFAATADRAAVDQAGLSREHPDDLNSSPWVVRRVDSAAAEAPLGLYLSYGDHQNLLLLLAQPAETSLSWRVAPLPGASPEGDGAGRSEAPNGVFLVDVGTLSGPVEVDLGHGPTLVDSPLDGPTLRPAAKPDIPAGWEDQGGGSGQSEPRLAGGAVTEAFANLNGNPHRPMAAFARCYGGGSLTFTLYPLQTKGPIGANGDAEITTSNHNAPPVARGRVPCDGGSHRAFAPAALATTGYELLQTSDRVQAYHYVLASPPRAAP